MASTAAGGKLTREELRKQKDLDAARKAGTAPPERDAEGKQINPHIPDFMSKAPWYLSTGQPGLQHHKADPKYLVQFDSSAGKLKNRYERGVQAQASTKYRKGACENCGAMTHKTIDCMERPRKRGARWTGRDIAPDENLQSDRKDNWDSKRDRWDGYDPADHKRVIEEYDALDAARQKLREEAVDKATDLKAVEKVAKLGKPKKAKKSEDDEDSFGSSSDEDDDDESKYADAADVAGQKLDTKNRVTVRNLRIREDTAKYLHNLDTESAYYDPKSRSMREAPDQALPAEESKFAGDNFQRMSGEAIAMQSQQLFAWQAEDRGQNVHVNANPTQAALVHRDFQKRKETHKTTSAVSMLDKYGGAEHLQTLPVELRSGQDEGYVEYSRTGQVIKGIEKAKAKSRYDEDVYPGNHTSVWGSYWKDGQWGYACCHSKIKSSYCAGQTAIEAEKEDDAGRLLAAPTPTTAMVTSESILEKKRRAEANEGERSVKRRVGDFGNEGVELDQDKLAKAMDRERHRISRAGDGESKYNGTGDAVDVTEEDMEAYRRLRRGTEDPMNQIKDDELLPL